MIYWRNCILGALTTAGLVSAAHSYGPSPDPKIQAFYNAVPSGFVACATDGKVCKVPAGATVVYVVYGTGSKYVTSQGTGDFTCLPKGAVKTSSASTPQDLGVADPLPNTLKTCYMMATGGSPANAATKSTQTSSTAAVATPAPAPAKTLGLTDDVLKSLTAATVPNFTLDQYNAMGTKVSLIPAAAIPGFSDLQIRGLGSMLANEQLLALSASQLNNLQRDWLGAIGKTKLLALLPKLPPNQLFTVLTGKVLLTSAEIQTIGADQFNALSTEQFQLLSVDIHKVLTVTQMAGLTSALVEAGWGNWTNPQLQKLTTSQLAGLKPEKIRDLPLASFSVDQIRALSGKQLSELPLARFDQPWFKNIIPMLTLAQVSGLTKEAAIRINKVSTYLIDDKKIEDALKNAANPPHPAVVPRPGDSPEIASLRGRLNTCITNIDGKKSKADDYRLGGKYQKLKGLQESSQLNKIYQDASAAYNKFRTKIYNLEVPKDMLEDCGEAATGFDQYAEEMIAVNGLLVREYEASLKTVTVEEAKIKAQLETCITSLKGLQTLNSSLNEDSKKIYNTKDAKLTTWPGVNKKINDFLFYQSVNYTAANLGDCQKLAADNSVGEEYSRLSGLKVEQQKADAVAAQTKAVADAAALKKAGDDAEAARKAKIEADQRASAAVAAADRDPTKLNACIDDVRARRNAVSTRYYSSAAVDAAASTEASPEAKARAAKLSAVILDFKLYFDKLIAEVDTTIKSLSTSKDASVAGCLTPWPQLDQLESRISKFEAQLAQEMAKTETEIAKKQEEMRVKAAVAREKWEAEHPTDIPGSCKAFCMVRHAGAGSKETECERVCTLTSKAVEKTLNYIVDESVVKVLDEGMKGLGLTKALCEVATGKAAEILAEVKKPLDQLKDKINEASEEACVKAKGSPARCRFVGRLVKTVSDAKACSDTASSLKNSLAKTTMKFDDKKKLLDKSKNGGKVSKEEESAIKDAAMEVGTESAATCESAKASDLIKAVMAPCVDAAAGGLWLGTHGGDM